MHRESPWAILDHGDPEVFTLIQEELERQRHGLELIASENFASPAVLSAAANPFTNKYAEGLPGKRYYGGCEVVDQLESLAISRACELFGARHANVQPHSGAQANAAVYLALLNPGDKILGLDLAHGGHLTHGSKVNFSGILYESHFYGVDPATETINFDTVRAKALEVRPRMILAGASAYSRTIDFAKFRAIADEVGAYLMVDMAHIAGLVAAGVHPSPLPHAHVVTTTTHKTLRGPRGGLILTNDDGLAVKLNKAMFPGIQGGPLEHIIAAKAVCFREALKPEFKAYQQQVVANASALAKELMDLDFKIVSGGTDNHLLLIDLSPVSVSGKQLEEALGKAAITVNKNTVPNEKRSPFVTSGVRMGTPAVTTRGMGVDEMELIARFTRTAFEHFKNDEKLATLRRDVIALAGRYPLYKIWS
ncbi:serine hydroxymethyltransferase [bacterium]|nr:serine hydroxymethyltransferase [bacterium]